MRVLVCAAVVVATLAAGTAVIGQSEVGSPAFTERASNTMTLRYGFRGASVLDKSTNKWVFIQMTTITRGRVEGSVNQVNDQFALAAGLHSVAVYDYSKHRWVELKPGGVDDSSGELKTNFVLTPTSVKVKLLNGPFKTYTSAGGWQ